MHLVHGSVRQARLASCGLLLTAGMTVFGADGPASTNAPSPRLRSWELPAITVEGRTSDLLREEELVGSYGQPRWTTQRRFPRVRVYVLPEDEREFEYWTRVDVPRHGPCEVQHFFEFEIGLPYRLQLDTYLVVRNEDGGFDGPTFYDGQFELRYALADWGKLPGNPALYAEYVWREAKADKVELKLLLGDTLAPRWHWGLNLVYEGETSGECENEYSATAGISYTVIDEKFAIGLEAETAIADTVHARGSFATSTFLGPSLQFRPVPNMHIDFTPLFGLNGSEQAKIFLNAGWEF
jgi:hypothetical protein